jgi:hypothetical protein
MSTHKPLDREEYIEQAYFFRVLRERLGENRSTQEVLERLDQEILSTTRLPLAIQFLAAELKHSGLLSSGFARLPHYFTPYQAFVIRATEQEGRRFSIDTALLVLEREARYRAESVPAAGLFVYQFEVLCRNRLGYDQGIAGMAGDWAYDADWVAFLDLVRRLGGLLETADLIYVRSEWYVMEQRRQDAAYQPPLPPLFGEKEGKIAKANRGRDPLYLFSALQRQLNYPEVPRSRVREDMGYRLESLQAKIRELEGRLRLIEGEQRGQLDLKDLKELGKPELLEGGPEIEIR